MESDEALSTHVGRMVQTVLGEILHEKLGITDTHNHVWIEHISLLEAPVPVLDQYDQICDELKRYRAAGGGAILDCQPGGCGRNAHQLAKLARATGVHIVACTGFHREKYYPTDYWLFSASAYQAAEHFLRELTSSVEETITQAEHRSQNPNTIKAGFIKIAMESNWNEIPQSLMVGAAEAAHQTCSLIEIHTEKGLLAEEAIHYFENYRVTPQKLVLCHMDKRPDPELHIELARSGALLEYDTFYRPKYDPETGVWPLIERMASEGLSDHIALATDMAESRMYSTIGNGPGLASLPTEIKSRLMHMGITENSIQQMLGGNIARRLAGLI